MNYNNEIYFRSQDGVNGYELWKSDGTAAGTVMVKRYLPGQQQRYAEFYGRG
ncbi:MAG: hypothetical protein WDO19_03045 [Bacteroidota bacterium]